MEIVWSKHPPSKPSQRLFTFKPGQSLRAILLGEFIGVEIHWVQKRSCPCCGAECRPCKDQVPKLWRAYVPCDGQWFIQTGRIGTEPMGSWSPKIEQGVLELTDAHAEFLEAGDLVGCQVEVHKPLGDPKQSLRIITLGMVENPSPSFDVKQVLYRVWRMNQVQGPRLMREEA